MISVLSGKILLFTENMVLFLRRKIKDNISEKNTWNVSTNVLERWFFKKILSWNTIFLVLSTKMIFLIPENMILVFRRKIKAYFPKNTSKYDIFYIICKNPIFLSYKRDIILLSKNQIRSSVKK